MLRERLKTARKEKKLTQEKLAELVNTTKGTISNYENGHSTPSNEMLTSLSNILGVSADYLLGITNKPNHKMGDHIFKAGIVLKYYTYTWTLKEDMTWDEIAENYHGFPKNIDDYDVSFRVEKDLDTNIEYETVYINKKILKDKDERDIAKRMAKMKKDLIEGNAEGEGLNFMGEPMSEEAVESLLEALEHAERIATLANKKFAPNKYRDK